MDGNKCPKCKGTGGSWRMARVGFGFSNEPRMVKQDCSKCFGTGRIPEEAYDPSIKGTGTQGDKYLMYP